MRDLPYTDGCIRRDTALRLQLNDLVCTRGHGNQRLTTNWGGYRMGERVEGERKEGNKSKGKVRAQSKAKARRERERERTSIRGGNERNRRKLSGSCEGRRGVRRRGTHQWNPSNLA